MQNNIGLDAQVYKDLFAKMSDLNNYKFTHNTNNINQSYINTVKVTTTNLDKYSSKRRRGRTIKRPGIGSWFRRLVGKPKKPVSNSKRVKKLAIVP